MRKTIIAPGEHYHIFNRGNNKQPLFLDEKDRIRFLFLIIYLQSPIVFYNLGRQTSHYVKNRAFNIVEETVRQVLKERYVELVNFVMMPNHFHAIVREVKKDGIAKYMQRVLCAYIKYFNTKYKKTGHLFQGPYKAVNVENNNQLLYLSTYIHRNPREIPKWKNKELAYPWSSYQDCSKENRWGGLLKRNIIIQQFSNGNEYKNFVETSIAKQSKEYSDDNLLMIDL